MVGSTKQRALQDRVASRDQRGETLIEILITIAIIGIAATALLGALVTSVTGSGVHRVLAQEETALKSYADDAKLQIELQSSPTPLYKVCATPSDYSAVVTPPVLPQGVTVTITAIAYWNGTAFVPTGSCPNPPGGANDLQLVTLAASAASGSTQTLSFVVRNPNYAP